MRAQELGSGKLVIFDIDDTLVNTDTRVNVVKNGKIIKQLNSHDFTHYKLGPGETFDFGEFQDAREFFTKARPIPGMIRQLKNDIATGNRVIMLTARSDFNDRDIFLDTFRRFGIDMDRVHVYRAGNLTIKAATEEKKKIILKHLLGKEHFDKLIMYDDSVPNLNAFLSLKQEYPWSKFYAWHVDPNGQATEYHRAVDEAFDRPYKGKWERSEYGDQDMLVKLPDGSNLSIMFNLDQGAYGDDEWTVEFWRGNSQDVTGQGDQQRIFATVLSAIKKFIDREHPERIRFSANKAVDSGKSLSRSNLYDRLVQRYANSWGYDVDIDDFADTTVYNLHSLKEGLAEEQYRIPPAIEQFLDSLNPDDCGVEDIGAYRIHFEGFTSDCKSSADYRRNPEAVYQQVYRDFIQREGGQKPVVQDMTGEERFPILYSIFRRKKLNEIGDKPQPYKPNPKRRRSLFHSEVDGNWVDVFFDRSPINGSLQITFAVNQNYEPAGPSSASRSTIRILSTVLNIIKQQLPEYIKKARPPAVTFTAKGQGRADLYRKYFVPVVQDILGPRWQLEDLPGETTLFSWRPVKQTVAESQQATAKQVLAYINKTHHEPFRPGEKMYRAVMAHPRWELQRVPLLNLNLPDQEYDDVDYYDNPPESDPYGRVMTVEPGHAGEVSQHLIDRNPIVIDADRYIIDGNHRAWAAKYLLNRDYIQAWVPVEQIKEVNYPDELTVSDQIQEYFYKRGYSLAGEGRDQMAFESPRGTILKVLGIGEDEREQVVRRYVRFFEQNQRNPFYPRIYNSGAFEVDGETYFVYEMERVNYVANEEATLDYIEKLMSAVDRGQGAEYVKKNPVPDEIGAKQLAGLLQATERMMRALGGTAPLDLSAVENLGRRDNGHLVIVDPYSL